MAIEQEKGQVTKKGFCPIKKSSVLYAFLRIATALALVGYFYMEYREHDRKSSGRDYREKRLLRHMESLNQGLYLVDDGGRSITRNSSDDMGFHVLLANVALIRKGFLNTDYQFSDQDLYMLSLILVVCVCLCIFIPGIPLPISLVSAGMIVTAYWTGTLKCYGTYRFPAVLVGVLTFTIIGLLIKTRFSLHGLASWLCLLALSTTNGMMTFFRKNAMGVALLPFLGLLLVMLFFRYLAWRQARLDPAIKTKALPKMLENSAFCAVGIILLGTSVISPILYYSNLKIFENLDGVEHIPKNNGHIVWHNPYIGIGATPYYNDENIVWNDLCAFNHALQVDSEASYRQGRYNEYEKVMRSLYIKVFWHNPNDFWRACWYKFKILVLSSKFCLMIIVVEIATLSILFLKYGNRLNMVLPASVLSVLAIIAGMLPPLLTNAKREVYQDPFHITLNGTIFLLLTLIALRFAVIIKIWKRPYRFRQKKSGIFLFHFL